MRDFSDKSWIHNQVIRPGIGERLLEWAEESILGKVVVYGGGAVLLSAVGYSLIWSGFAIAVAMNL